ncbi:MAG: hypothetical protein ACE15B_12655 [Bryobacteraceae bacterium]
MLSAISLALALPYFSVLMEDGGAWPRVLSAIGMQERPSAAESRVVVLGPNAAATPSWQARVESGTILVLQGESSLAEQFGFRKTKEFVRAGSLTDVHNPKLPVIWERALEMPVFAIPAAARVFARERWTGAPLLAGFRHGAGAVLWAALSPGARGYERFPYLLHALVDLGLEAPFRSRRLWVFFDSSYRMRVDLDYFAQRWRRAGIAALHVAGWHFYDPDPGRDRYLHALMEACRRQGIQVYCWLELPHVSDAFWERHPEWREKTAAGQDAHLDWRRLMNLADPDCARAAAAGIRDLVARFDWDGVNLAELYFESLEGIGNPSRFTPFNERVRAAFRAQRGFDPLEIFNTRTDETSRRAFLDYRAELAWRIQQDWLREIDAIRRERPHLDLVLTHVDDRFDSNMRDAIGADAARLMPLLDRYSFTFLVEDPATVWHLGPERYAEIARRYRALTPRHDRLAIDINIAERYQDVYPTKQQTGVELLQLVHVAAGAFPRVALYGENSILQPDLSLLPSAAAAVTRLEQVAGGLAVDSPNGVGLAWQGPALVDGRPWPLAGGGVAWLPKGPHTLQSQPPTGAAFLQDFNGEVLAARYAGRNIEISYQSATRAFATFDRKPAAVEIDGAAAVPEFTARQTIRLPRGQHLVTIRTE